MTVQEIFDTPVVSQLEESILRLEYNCEHRSGEGYKKALVELLDIRQNIVNSMFVMTEEHKRLLGEFNSEPPALS